MTLFLFETFNIHFLLAGIYNSLSQNEMFYGKVYFIDSGRILEQLGDIETGGERSFVFTPLNWQVVSLIS